MCVIVFLHPFFSSVLKILLLCLVNTSDEVRDQLEFLQNKLDCCLVIDGDSLQV